MNVSQSRPDREAWRRENAEWLAAQVDSLPPLTRSQREQLRAILGTAPAPERIAA